MRPSIKHLDVLDKTQLSAAVSENNITILVHLSAILSAAGELDPTKALSVNLTGFQNALEVAKENSCTLLCPSTIATFGPDGPKDKTPDLAVMRPTTIYGITKVHMELMGTYFWRRYGVDFRSLRLPGIISPSTLAGGGTTDYAVEVFHAALKNMPYSCFLSHDTRLPMMYIDDCVEAFVQLLFAPEAALTRRVYNIHALSFTPAELFDVIKTRVKDLRIEYKPDFRQLLAESWPRSLDDSAARRDWGWTPKYSLEAMVDRMLTKLA